MNKKRYRLKQDLYFCGNCGSLLDSINGRLKGDYVNVGNDHPYNPNLVEALGKWIPKKYLEEVKEND